MAAAAFTSFHVCLFSCLALTSMAKAEEFIYNRGFLDANLQLDGSANIRSNGLLQLTNTSGLLNGRAFYPSPINFNNRSSSAESLSFSTNIVITIVPRLKDSSGHGIAFVISHSTDFSHAAAIQYLGLVNESTNGHSPNMFFAVEFDTIFSLDIEDVDGNHVGIDLNGVKLNQSVASAYFSNEERKNISLELNSGHLIQGTHARVGIRCEAHGHAPTRARAHVQGSHSQVTRPCARLCDTRLRHTPVSLPVPTITEVMQYLEGNASLLAIPLESAPYIMPSSILETFQVPDQTTEISLSVADNSGSDSIILFSSSAGKGLSLNSLSSADTVLRTGR
ncbi:hypothetical protein Gohar_024183 [Gossypium harknessii]|uniref:Legume lectin domain-containing protein n=1 Tax=Gossypium harknessii TaxID=34285 RepID=A0A7J9HF77_9ROSI|nr:hypothetical protein [Gossypium harknessii]